MVKWAQSPNMNHGPYSRPSLYLRRLAMQQRANLPYTLPRFLRRTLYPILFILISNVIVIAGSIGLCYSLSFFKPLPKRFAVGISACFGALVTLAGLVFVFLRMRAERNGALAAGNDSGIENDAYQRPWLRPRVLGPPIEVEMNSQEYLHPRQAPNPPTLNPPRPPPRTYRPYSAHAPSQATNTRPLQALPLPNVPDTLNNQTSHSLPSGTATPAPFDRHQIRAYNPNAQPQSEAHRQSAELPAGVPDSVPTLPRELPQLPPRVLPQAVVELNLTSANGVATPSPPKRRDTPFEFPHTEPLSMGGDCPPPLPPQPAPKQATQGHIAAPAVNDATPSPRLRRRNSPLELPLPVSSTVGEARPPPQQPRQATPQAAIQRKAMPATNKATSSPPTRRDTLFDVPEALKVRARTASPQVVQERKVTPPRRRDTPFQLPGWDDRMAERNERILRELRER